MYVSEVLVIPGANIVLETRRVTGPKALLALAVDELLCSHEGRTCDETFCLIAPPVWTYRVGLGFRFSLGSRLWHLGQWATCMNHPVVREEVISDDTPVVAFGWDREALAEALIDFGEE